MRTSNRTRILTVRRTTALLLAAATTAAMLAAQATQAVTELWHTLDSRYVGVAMDLGPSDHVSEVGFTVVGDVIVTKKIDRDGNLLWERVYDPAERVRATWLAVDKGGNTFVSGFIVTGSYATAAGWVTLKYGPTGTLLWVDHIPGSVAQTLRIETDTDGNAYVAGWFFADLGVVKYSPNGTRLWVRTFDNSGASDRLTNLALSPDGQFVAAVGRSAQSILVVVYDAGGNLAWSFTRNDIGPAEDAAFTAANQLVAGAGIWTPEMSHRMALLKFSTSGAPLWIRTYGAGDFVQRVAVDSAGNIAATGTDQALTGMPYLNWVTIKTDAAGNLLWSRRRDAHQNNDEIPYFLTIDPFDAIYVIGQSGPGPGGGTLSITRMATAKYASDGTQQWVAVGTTGRGLVVRIGSDNTVFVFGDNQMFTARYAETGLKDLPPNAPTALTAEGWFTGSQHVINLAWQDNSDNEFWFTIERCTGASCTDFLAVDNTRGENAVTFRDRTVATGTTYSYRVKAVGAAGSSGYSNTAQGTTGAIAPPAAPSDLTATITGDTITLNWSDNSSDELQFPIERCEGAGCSAFTQINAVDDNITEFVDYEADPGKAYSYRVRAWNSGGYSGYSNVATASGTPAPPPAPTSLVATAVSSTAIRLQWMNNSSIQDGIAIERCRGVSCTTFKKIAEVAGTATKYRNTGLPSKTVYTYRIRAFNTGGFSPYSNKASAKTQ